MSVDAIAVIVSILGGFLVHLFYFGRAMGRMESSVKHLGDSFEEFKAAHFISRDEFEARIKDMKDLAGAVIRGK